MSDAELALSSSGLRVLVGRCYSGSASMYVVGYGSVCLCIESSRAGRDPWAWAWRVGSAAGRDRYVTRGFPPMRRDFPGVRGGQLVFFYRLHTTTFASASAAVVLRASFLSYRPGG